MDLFFKNTSHTIAKAGTFEWAMTMIKEGRFVKRHCVKNNTFIVLHKGRLYQWASETSVRYPYVPTNKDITANDWHEWVPDDLVEGEFTCVESSGRLGKETVMDELGNANTHISRLNEFLKRKGLQEDFENWNMDCTSEV